MHIERAPEPTDIFWENQNVPVASRIKKVTKVFLATLVLIGICFGIIYGLNIAKRRLNEQ